MSATQTDILDELFEETVNQVIQTPPAPVTRQDRLFRKNYTHEGMADLIIANPGISQNEIAVRVGYSAAWVSTVMCTDAFQALLAKRKEELVDPLITATVNEKFVGILNRSMEILQEKLSGAPSTISENLALRSLELTSRALGYGAKKDTIAVQVNVDNHIEELGDRLTNLLVRRKAEVTTVDMGDEG